MMRVRRQRKVCVFCKNNVNRIDYKNASFLQRFISDRGKILPKRATGNCARHQRRLAIAIKRAREVALLPFVVR